MINVIVSHDVDHLYAKDHWFRDMIYPKMWVRTTLQFLRKQITGREWWQRNTSCFRQKRHNLEAIMEFDRKYGIQSTFFFGMNQGLGMSYKPQEAKAAIELVQKQGFSAGVHGIEYQDSEGMLQEFQTFKNLIGVDPDGIRMHYVRFDNQTFEKLSTIGYPFDTTEFDKQKNGSIKSPYKVGSMWEFPLTIMDGYLPQNYAQAKQKTMEILDECKEKNLQFITVLFHDYQFCDDYQDIRDWYIWLMKYFSESTDYSFISYYDAIAKLES